MVKYTTGVTEVLFLHYKHRRLPACAVESLLHSGVMFGFLQPQFDLAGLGGCRETYDWSPRHAVTDHHTAYTATALGGQHTYIVHIVILSVLTSPNQTQTTSINIAPTISYYIGLWQHLVVNTCCHVFARNAENKHPVFAQ